jgi:hypothetical protein
MTSSARHRGHVPDFDALLRADYNDLATYESDHGNRSSVGATAPAFPFTKKIGETGTMRDRHIFYPALSSENLHHTKRRNQLDAATQDDALFYSSHFPGGLYAHVSVFRNSWDSAREFHVTVYHYDASGTTAMSDCSVFFTFPRTPIVAHTRKRVCNRALEGLVNSMVERFVAMVVALGNGTQVRTTTWRDANVAGHVQWTPLKKARVKTQVARRRIAFT